jgi:hypothetical protein
VLHDEFVKVGVGPGPTHLILTIFPRRLEKGKGASE